MADNNLKVAILSGKGGTGKTLIAVNLATVAKCATYIDCDVEEPNGRLFLKPQSVVAEPVNVGIPIVDNTLCNGCKKCVEFCAFNALAYTSSGILVFEDVCHSCGGCKLVCPTGAISEKDKLIGWVERGISDKISVSTGILKIGQASGVPIINKLLETDGSQKNTITFIDCPPGSACVVMDSIKDADYCVLVAEPTIFGAHNLNLVYELVTLFNKPFGIVLNKCIGEDNPSLQFAKQKGAVILASIPFDEKLGLLNSNAEIAAKESSKYAEIFQSLLSALLKEASYQTAINS